jgi:hypothetical protein
LGPSNTDLHHDRCISARVWGSVGGPCSQGLLAEGRGKPHHCSETMSGPSCNQTIGKSISFLCTDLVIQKHHSPVHQSPRVKHTVPGFDLRHWSCGGCPIAHPEPHVAPGCLHQWQVQHIGRYCPEGASPSHEQSPTTSF